MSSVSVHQGVIRGNSIELIAPPGLPDGQQVSVVITPSAVGRQRIQLPPGEGIRSSAGGWSDDPEGLDRFLEEVRRDRDADAHRDQIE